MSQNNQLRQLPYDAPSVLTRVAAQLTQNTAGASATSGKFYAWTQLQVYGVTFATVTPGTSTYTVSGTATNPATQFYAIYISNTNTTGTAVTQSTNTIGPFTIGGTGNAGTATNYFVQGTQGGLAGGFTGPYAINTLGGTNTVLTWGTNTFVTTAAAAGQTQVGSPGGQNQGFGGLPMNPGDVLYFVGGTDATAVVVPILQYGVQPVNGSVVA